MTEFERSLRAWSRGSSHVNLTEEQYATLLHLIPKEVWSMTPQIWGLTATVVGGVAFATGWVLKSDKKRGTTNFKPTVSGESGSPVIGKDGRIAGVRFKKRGVRR